MTRNNYITVNRVARWVDEKGVRDMVGVEADWSASTDPDGADLVRIIMDVEFPCDDTVSIGAIEEEAVTRMIGAAKELSALTPQELLSRLRASTAWKAGE